MEHEMNRWIGRSEVMWTLCRSFVVKGEQSPQAGGVNVCFRSQTQAEEMNIFRGIGVSSEIGGEA